MYTGPKVTNDNLIFGFDTGYGVADTATSTRFYPGQPTTNLQSSNQTSGIVNGMSGISIAHVGEEDGWQKYSMNGTFTGGTYPYIMYLPNTSFTGGTKYSTQVKIKTNVPNKFNYFGTGINYVNQPMDHGGTSSSTVLADGSRLAKREGFAYTSSVSQPGYLLTNPINNTTFSSSTDFVYVKDFQVEQQDHSTPHTSTSRSNTTSLIDLKRTEAITLANMSFDSTGQPEFDGTDDYIDLGSDVAISPINQGWTAEYVFNSDDASVLQHFNGAEEDTHNANWLALYQSYLQVWDHGASVWKKGSTVFSDNTWYHIAFVQENGTSMQFYVNSVAEGGDHASFSWTASRSALNCRYVGMYEHSGGYSRRFNGHIPIARLYDAPLTAAQIKQNYNAYKKRFNI